MRFYEACTVEQAMREPYIFQSQLENSARRFIKLRRVRRARHKAYRHYVPQNKGIRFEHGVRQGQLQNKSTCLLRAREFSISLARGQTTASRNRLALGPSG